MHPALLVDLDADYYTSTAQALRFLLREALLRVGSYVYIDDINYRPWFSKYKRSLIEAKRAHVEVSHEWGLEWDLLSSRVQHLYWRPVLVLLRCARCAARNPNAAAELALEMRLRRVQYEADAARKQPSRWLQRAVVGTCGVTHHKQKGRKVCAKGSQGVLGLAVDTLDSWEDAADECMTRCSQCARCRYVTLSLYWGDCSFFYECDLPAVKYDNDFRSISFADLVAANRGGL